MTQEQKRIKLAEAAGILSTTRLEYFKANGINIFGESFCYSACRADNGLPLPDYFNDLNAVHELENAAIRPKRLWYKYCLNLPGPSFDEGIGATAAERCEALGLTLNLWEASK